MWSFVILPRSSSMRTPPARKGGSARFGNRPTNTRLRCRSSIVSVLAFRLRAPGGLR